MYLNLEIPDRDIIRRAIQYNRGKDNLSDNIYLVDEMTVEEIDEWAGEDATETWMSNHILSLPIDQRYDEEDMERIIKIIKSKKWKVECI